MEWRILLIYIYSTMKIIFSTAATQLSVPGKVIQQIPIGTVLHLGINGTTPNYVITMVGVHELTIYLDTTLQSNCCWRVVVNTTGILNSCTIEHLKVSKNPFEMKVQPQTGTCNKQAGLNLVINSKRCLGNVFQERDKHWYIPGSIVFKNCKVGNKSGRKNFTCKANGSWQPSGKCNEYTDSILRPAKTTPKTDPYTTINTEQLTSTKAIEQTSVVTLKTSLISSLSEFSTQSISYLSNKSTRNSYINGTYILSPNNPDIVGTLYQSTVGYNINQSTPGEYFSSLISPQSSFIGPEINGSYGSGNINTFAYFHSESLITSFDHHIASTSFESDNSSETYFQSEALFTSFGLHSILSSTFELGNSSGDLNSRANFSEVSKTSAVPEYGVSTLDLVSQTLLPTLTTDNSKQADIKDLNISTMTNHALENSIYLSTAILDGSSAFGTIVNATASKLYNGNFSIGISVDVTDNLTLTNRNNQPKIKKFDQEHPNSDIALGVTIVLFAVIVIVLLTMIFRVVWKTRDKNEPQQVIQSRKFADVAPLAQFRESVETRQVFGEDLSYIDLGEVNESNTDDDVSSPGNSESSSRAEEVNKDGGDNHSVVMTSGTICNTKLKTFTTFNNVQNNSHRHNYNQKVGACNSLKKSQTQKEIRHITGKNNDVYALSYKHKQT